MSPIPGAIACTAALFALYALIATVHDWWCKARLWDRYCRARGGEGKALEVVEIAELLLVEHTDELMRRGFRAVELPRRFS